MKKLTKIVLGAVLSVAMVVTGGLAALTMNKAQASSLSIAGHDLISTVSPGATVEYGTYKQVTSGTEFTGIKLEGKSSAIFRLGSIDLAKSNWLGTYTTLTGKGNSFIEYVFNPSAAVTSGEIKYILINLTQGSKTVTIKTVPSQYDSGCLADELLIRAQANGQTAEGMFREGQTSFQVSGTLRKGYVYKPDAQILFGAEYTKDKYEIGGRGNAELPVQLFYNHVEDASGNVTESAVYTSSMYKAGYDATKGTRTKGLGTSFLVRDLVSTNEIYNDADPWATPFKMNADGTMPVDVEIRFGGVDSSVTTSSIVITKLGDLDLSKTANIKDDGNVVGGIEIASGSASVGEYSYTSVAASGTNDATLTETLNVRRGLKLTGSTGAIFDLGQIDISKSSWSGTETTITGAYNPFIEFVYHPTVEKLTQRQSELKQFTIKLTDATDSTNYVEIKVSSVTHDGGGGNVYQMMAFKTKGSTQSNFGAWRNGKGLVTGSGYVSKEVILDTANNYQFGSSSASAVRPNGMASRPAALIYDNNTLFSNVTFATSSPQLSTSYAVRNFADTYSNADTTWSGFKGNNVNVTITFDNATTETSIVLTSLGGNNFTGRTLGAFENVEARNGSTVTLNDLLYFETSNGVKLAYGESEFVKGYKVNGNEHNGSTVVVNGETTVEFLGEDGATICSTTITPVSVTVAPIFTNGGRYEIWNGTTDVTDGGVADNGYEIRMYPGKQEYTGLTLKDVRTLMFNDVAYAYDTANKQNAENLPFTFVDKGEDSYYTYTINESDSVVFNPSIYFDNYCKITVTDPYKTYEPVYIWTNERYQLPVAQINYQAHYTGNSNDGKELFGYIRKDVGKNYETKEVVTRADGFTYAYGNDGLGQIYYQSNAIGKLDVTSADFIEARKVAYSVVPNMEFEAFYFDFNTRFEMKFTMNADGTPNESRSGLRYVVELNKEDWNKYMYYTSDQSNGKSEAVFRTYITTQSQYEAAGNDFSKIESAGTNWQTSGWDAEVGKNNKLNLQCLSVNGSDPIQATNYGFMFYRFAENEQDIWLDDKYNENNDTYKAFAITISTLKSTNAEQNYLITTFMSNSYLYGATTGRISTVQQTTVKGLSEELFTKNVLVDSDSAKYDFVDQNGVRYSSEYTMEHVQWLADKAGKGLTFTKA